jgi:hypothetical protein
MDSNERELERLVISVKAKNGMTARRMDRSLERLRLRTEKHLE